MNALMYKFALLLSDESPFFRAVINDPAENKIGKPLRKAIFNVTYDAMKTWAKGTKRPSMGSVRKIVNGMNDYRAHSRLAKRHSKRFLISDFTDPAMELSASSDFLPAGQKAEWFDFALKLGYDETDWRRVQHDIEQVFYRLGVRGRENSCSRIKAERLVSDCGGINYIYFVAPPAGTGEQNDDHLLVRATFRVREPVRVSAENDVYYVPARLKLDTPSREILERNKIEYVGTAYFQSGFLYLSLIDTNSMLDYMHMIVNLTRPIGSMYGGIYTSISGYKQPYSSGMVLDNRERLLSPEQRVDRNTILEFMYSKPKVFTEPNGGDPSSSIFTVTSDDPLEALDDDQKEYIRKVVGNNAFIPKTQPFKRSAAS